MHVRVGVLVALIIAAMAGPAHAAAGWSAPKNINTGQLQSVSCATDSFCAAVDATGHVVTAQSGVWASPAAIGTGLTSISCASHLLCAATGEASGASSGLIYNGSAWSSTAFDGHPDQVSCTSASFCVAVGPGVPGTEAGAPTTDNEETYSGGVWTASTIGDGYTMNGVSCTSNPSLFCLALDNHDHAVTYTAAAGWSQPQTTGSTTQTVSCASDQLCFATDQEGNVLAFNGSTWTAPTSLGSAVAWVSCASTVFCVAAGSNATAYLYDGSGWAPTGPLPADTTLTGLSCADMSCVAITSIGDETTYPATASTGSTGPTGTTGTTAPGRAIVVFHSSVAEKMEATLMCPAHTAGCTATIAATVREKLRAGKPIAVAAGAGQASLTSKTVAVAGKTVSLRSGQVSRVYLSLNAAGRTLIRTFHKLAVRFTVVSDGVTIESITIHLKPSAF